MLPCMLIVIFFIFVFLAPILFVPSLGLEILPADAETHEESNECDTAEDSEGYCFALRFDVRGQREEASG